MKLVIRATLEVTAIIIAIIAIVVGGTWLMLYVSHRYGEVVAFSGVAALLAVSMFLGMIKLRINDLKRKGSR